MMYNVIHVVYFFSNLPSSKLNAIIYTAPVNKLRSKNRAKSEPSLFRWKISRKTLASEIYTSTYLFFEPVFLKS